MPAGSDIDLVWDRSVLGGELRTEHEQCFLFTMTSRGSGSLYAHGVNFKALGTDGISYQGRGFIGTVGGVAGLGVTLNREETGRGWVCFQMPERIGITRVSYAFANRTVQIAFDWAPRGATTAAPPVFALTPPSLPAAPAQQPVLPSSSQAARSADVRVSTVTGPGRFEATGTTQADRIIVTASTCRRLQLRYDSTFVPTAGATGVPGVPFVAFAGAVYTSDGKVWNRDPGSEGPLTFAVQPGEFVILHNSKNILATSMCVG